MNRFSHIRGSRHDFLNSGMYYVHDFLNSCSSWYVLRNVYISHVQKHHSLKPFTKMEWNFPRLFTYNILELFQNFLETLNFWSTVSCWSARKKTRSLGIPINSKQLHIKNLSYWRFELSTFKENLHTEGKKEENRLTSSVQRQATRLYQRCYPVFTNEQWKEVSRGFLSNVPLLLSTLTFHAAWKFWTSSNRS
jgi:hypothetical protein